MHEEIYSHPMIKPLLDQGPSVPVQGIEALAREIERNEVLSRQCNRLFRFEASFNATQGAGSYLALWLAFALALARDEEAISSFIDLFNLIDPVEHDMLWEMAQFALWQYGDLAVQEVLNDFDRVVEMDYIGYFLGVLEVVGLSGNQLLRRRVADKVMEALLSPNTAPAALMGLIDIALILEDPRLPGVVNGWRQEVSTEDKQLLDEAERLLMGADEEVRNDEYALPWQELAEYSAEHFSIHFQAGPHDYTGSGAPDDLEEDFKELAGSFCMSYRFQDVPKKWREKPDQAIDLLVRIFNLLYETFGTLPEEADAAEVGALMKDVLPRRMIGDTDAFRSISPILTAFFRFVTDAYSKEEGEEYARQIRTCEREMLRRAADPECWDGAKSAAMKSYRD